MAERGVFALWGDGPQARSDSATERLWRGFMTGRVLVALVLLVIVGRAGVEQHLGALTLCLGYVALTVGARLRLRLRPGLPLRGFSASWVATVGVDILVFTLLGTAQTVGLNFGPLFAVPLLLAAVLGSLLTALATAALISLSLLWDAWAYGFAHEAAARFFQAGLTGTGFFIVAVLAQQLGERLLRAEYEAERTRQVAQVQARVNELVIETLGDGVVVLERAGVVRAANPAARELLGAQTPLPFSLVEFGAWGVLAALVTRTFDLRQPQTGEASVDLGAAGPRQLRVRTRLAAVEDAGAAGLCVMFLQDLREMQQRLHTEKLAAMGRMSAAVAHEIRNPLSAIVQANALLDEDLIDLEQKRLSGLVRSNAQRLARVVDDVLNLARVREQPSEQNALLLDDAVGLSCDEWVMQTHNAQRLQLDLGAPSVLVLFETDHLRRVLVNLLDNAARYASEAADAIQVRTLVDAQRGVRLIVWSDGAALDANTEHHLFEPFFSSQSRSSGLGLYICRELCERHGAAIGYRRAYNRVGVKGLMPRSGNEFFVQFHNPQGSALLA